MGMVRYPLPITAAMLAPANGNVTHPVYTGAGVATDWSGGVVGNDQDVATANVAIANQATAGVGTIYVPRNQLEKSALAAPLRPILADIGLDYGAYAGAAGRTGTIAPRSPYPSVLP
jgi:hypothetical protein